jgi:hypothetical protein
MDWGLGATGCAKPLIDAFWSLHPGKLAKAHPSATAAVTPIRASSSRGSLTTRRVDRQKDMNTLILGLPYPDVKRLTEPAEALNSKLHHADRVTAKRANLLCSRQQPASTYP